MTQPFQFNAADYAELHALVFRGDYPGYKPEVIEIPNGDGKADAAKRYAHIALKYLPGWGTAAERCILMSALAHAHDVAERVAEALGVPKAFLPDLRYGALRVLEYPPGADSAAHQDFDLFTLHLYRNTHAPFYYVGSQVEANQAFAARHCAALELNPRMHIGQLGEAIGVGTADTHGVDPAAETQHAIVYFAIPDHDVVIEPRPADGERITVKAWLNERMARSRTEFKAYK